MISMKRKIRRPFMALIVLIPMATLFLFGAALQTYFFFNIQNTFREAVDTMDSIVKKELLHKWDALDEAETELVFARLYKALRASDFSAGIHLFLLDEGGQIAYPTTRNMAEEKIAAVVRDKSRALDLSRVQVVRTGQDQYLMFGYAIEGASAAQGRIVFGIHTGIFTSVVQTLHVVLLGLMCFGAVLAGWLAARLSDRIARPVVELSQVVKRVGDRGFAMTVKPKSDIEEIHQLYTNIGEMVDKLEAYDKAQKAFLQNASHELKTPLMSIQGYAEGIDQGVVPDARGAARIISSESIRLNRLVEELLTLSRIEGQNYQDSLEPINLGDDLKDFVQRMGGVTAKEQKELLLHLPKDAVWVYAEDTLLAQAIMNVVANGLRYACHKVDIVLEKMGEQAVVRICDDGAGMDEKDIARLFDRFYKGKGGHFGLGLAIAQSAVHCMGGSIRAYNGAVGAVFEIRLKCVTPPAEEGLVLS